MSFGHDLSAIIKADPFRWNALREVRTLDLPDCWVAAGFVRDAVWDHLHGRPIAAPCGDVDVVWFQASDTDPDTDREVEGRLRIRHAGLDWSVKNQARMHIRNGDNPYTSVAEAMRAWPETVTAIAVRRTDEDELEINAPFGLNDLFALQLTPTKSFIADKRSIFESRIAEKMWLERYPLLKLTC